MGGWLLFSSVRFLSSVGGRRIDLRADNIITMMRSAETIGPKSNMDQVNASSRHCFGRCVVTSVRSFEEFRTPCGWYLPVAFAAVAGRSGTATRKRPGRGEGGSD